MIHRIAGVAAALLLLSACATGSRVRVDVNRGVSMSGYRTFAWMSDDPVANARVNTAQVSAVNRQRIVTAIAATLAEKGYVRVESRADADFVADYSAGTQDRLDVERYPLEFRGPWRADWPNRWWQDTVSVYSEGHLRVDIFDGRTREPVWSGAVKGEVGAQEIDNAETEIPRAIRAILAKFPSRAPTSR